MSFPRTYEQATATPCELSFLLTPGGEVWGHALVSTYSGVVLYCEDEDGTRLVLSADEMAQAQAVVDERRALEVV